LGTWVSWLRLDVLPPDVGPRQFLRHDAWLDTFEAVTRPPPLAAITCVAHDLVPADPRPGEGLGDFEDVRALLRRTVAR